MGTRAADDRGPERRAVELAEALLREARAQQTSEERAQAGKLARMMADPHGKELTIALADQAFRSHRPERIADQLAYLLDRHGVPKYMDWWERAALVLGGAMAHYLPSLVVPPIVNRLRHETQNVILPGEEEDLRRYLEERRRAGMRLNLNQLGEAILGEAEAARRLAAYLALLARDDVEYISVKVSSVFSQIDLVAFRATVGRVAERLRTLYREAARHRYRHPDGRVTPKFINLDMEEYRDLDLTVTAFQEVLDEPEFLPLSAGIVLQAYLPDSYRVQRELTAWALARRSHGGAPIKLRIVKGANLAMERIEGAAHGWPQAPYETKAEVDANYKRMVEFGCQPRHAEAVHLGIASHNLFDIAYGLTLREAHGVTPWVEFEMLEGMANHQARAVQSRAGGLLLYAPVVRAEDFHSAIAYLVRRLDENTAPENFLRHVFDLEPGSPEWVTERDRFLAAFDLKGDLSDAPRRTQDRSAEERGPAAAPVSSRFLNAPDTDWTLRQNRAWIEGVVDRWRGTAPDAIPLQVGGAFHPGARDADGHDPSRPGGIAYRYALAGPRDVDRALDAARAAQPAWGGLAAPDRRALLEACADELERRRGDLTGAMILDGAKTVTEADAEVSEAVDFARYYARALVETTAELADCAMAPLGVVVVTPPWNFPLSIPAGGTLAALAAGNTVILKPAPEAVLVGWWLARCLWEAGVPQSVLQFLPCPDDEVGKALVTDTRVGAVILTGSVETARLFLGWRPDLHLLAETSGKNAIIVTALADRDQAIRDLVRSAFGHNGQKCSAASLAICEAEVYDDPDFRRQLRDAASSLAVESAWELGSRVTPLTQPPGAALRRALTVLDEGEEWLLEPRPDPEQRRSSGRPASSSAWGAARSSTAPSASAPCWGSCAPRTSTRPSPSRTTRHSASRAVSRRWTIARSRAGSTGSRRAPSTSTGRSRERSSAVSRSAAGRRRRWGPGPRRAGPTTSSSSGGGARSSPLPATVSPLPEPVAALLECCLRTARDADERALLLGSAASYARAWRDHFSREHDPSGILGERNGFRYRPCRRIVARGAAPAVSLAQVALAASVAGVPLTISLTPESLVPEWLAEHGGATVVVETEAGFVERLAYPADAERVRVWGPVSIAARAAANGVGLTVIDAPVLANGRLELRWYLREQTVSRVLHRYGSVPESRTE